MTEAFVGRGRTGSASARFGEGARWKVALLPNKRLKLPGGDRFRGTGVLCATAHELSFNDTAPGGRVARSLSAIR